ncbi:MAG TPA: ABC transporter substrate-binding protein [Nocardioides sp.]|uniref:ABC transporter substrate-binding protein n=1 Tax=Nocardioides sp. TaxID=35761 RepID=UPI002B553C5C|nr:ABC transporter substrate-binding protein [Nocardioides sp.]HQR25946.1 ABC transporter substrate-binding protein [Nocardioides sp.]
MKRPKTYASISAIALVSALALSSCGSDSNDSSTASESDNTSSAAPEAKGDGELVVGTLLPQTGDLAFLGPPEFAGVDLAIQEINDNGGVLGKPVKQQKSDSGDGTPDIAGSSVDKLLNAGADAIIGAAASSVSLSVIDKITGAGVVQFSPANTSPELDTHPDNDLYFRTSPSDVLQGEVLGNLLIEDGKKNVAILARQDSYGEGLANRVEQVVTDKGGAVATKQLYAADAQNFTAEVNKVAAAKPDAVVIIGFDETKKMIPALIAKGVGPQDLQTYFVDGNTADYSQDFKPGTLAGVKATFPTPPELDPTFKERLLQVDPKLEDFTYAPQAYDAMTMIALAAEAASDDAGTSIGSKLIEISEGGTQCSDYKTCLDLVKSGEDIDYEGQSGPCDLNSVGSVMKATIGIQEYGNDNTYKQVDSVSGVLP